MKSKDFTTLEEEDLALRTRTIESMHMFPLFGTWWRWWILPSSQLQHKCVLIDSHESHLNLQIQSAKDYVPALIDAGVGCFKIEGRLKGEETDRGTSKLQKVERKKAIYMIYIYKTRPKKIVKLLSSSCPSLLGHLAGSCQR